VSYAEQWMWYEMLRTFAAMEVINEVSQMRSGNGS
jgi:hypothetical protein